MTNIASPCQESGFWTARMLPEMRAIKVITRTNRPLDSRRVIASNSYFAVNVYVIVPVVLLGASGLYPKLVLRAASLH